MTIIKRDGVEGKICSKCKIWKPLERFSRKKGSRDGYNWLCKPCNSPKPRSGPPIVPAGKVCTQCHQWKSIEEYHAKKGSIDDHRSACKPCTNAANKARADLNRDWERERQRVYYKQNREAIRAKRDLYKDRMREMVRQWHKRNREKMRLYQKEYIVRNPEKARRIRRNYYLAHRDQAMARYHRRRARKQAAPGRFTAAEWRALKAHYEHTCLRCGRREPEVKLTPDHVVPLSMGGSNSIENIQPLCRPCNCGKGARMIDYRPVTSDE